MLTTFIEKLAVRRETTKSCPFYLHYLERRRHTLMLSRLMRHHQTFLKPSKPLKESSCL